VPVFREAKELFHRKAELMTAGGGGAVDELHEIQRRLGVIKAQCKAEFPLSEQECGELRRALQARIRALYESEVAARDALGAAAGAQ
jgi:hypothetical protein